MRKVSTVNIGGTAFYIDEDAREILDIYFNRMKDKPLEGDGANTSLPCVEVEAEKILNHLMISNRQVIAMDVVKELIKEMGVPDDFSEESKKIFGCDLNQETDGAGKGIYRDGKNKIISGVCGGIAAYLNMNPSNIRILFFAFLCLGNPLLSIVMVMFYAIMDAFVLEATTPAQRRAMRGGGDAEVFKKRIVELVKYIRQKISKDPNKTGA